ncbi:MAG: FadR/GntR family transcriptional regulator [Lachnospiraceae bacterium]
MENPKLNNKKVYEYVFDYFLEQILSGELKIDDKIPPEREIAQKLGVSRNSVREVMHMLEINGLIECVQGSGNYVRCNPQKYMLKSVNMVMSLLRINYIEIFYIRAGYELTALKLAIDAATEEEIEEIHRILLKMDQATNVKESANLDIKFHSHLIAASHNRLLILYADMLSDLMNEFIEDFRARILMNRKNEKMLRKSHWDIYNGLKERNYAAGRVAMEKHFKIVNEHIEKISLK